MTQKRGLGRGLGALIPGAGPTDARSEAQEARPTSAPAPASDVAPAPEAAGEETAPLRARSHPRTRPEPGEAGATSRPVDMFFSGEPVGGGERGGGRGAGGRDVAGAMARAAAERRSAAKKPAARRRSAGADDAATTAEETPAEVVPAPSAEAPAPRSASETKASTSETAASSSSTRKRVGAASSSAKKGAAASTPARGKGAPASTPARARSAAAAPKDVPEAAPAAESPEPAVEVEAVTPNPARRPDAAPTITPEPVAAETPAAEPPAPEMADPEIAAPEATAHATSAEDQAAEGGAALLPVPGAEFAEIPIHEIRENPRNPRTLFDDDALDELAYSLREVGVLQPVVVRPIPATDAGESFELVMGERRWRAARRAGLAAIPAIIRETSDDNLLRDALLENLHRSQLNPLEEAAAYQQLLEDFGCTQEELADRIGRSRPQISNTLRLMKLPPLVQRRLASGVLSAGHARALLGLDSPALMEELAQRIVAEGLSVRAVERLVARGLEPAPARSVPRRSSYDPRVVDFTSRLANRLEAPVRIDVGKRKGRITLEFTNLEDLERLMERIGLEQLSEDDGSEG